MVFLLYSRLIFTSITEYIFYFIFGPCGNFKDVITFHNEIYGAIYSLRFYLTFESMVSILIFKYSQN